MIVFLSAASYGQMYTNTLQNNSSRGLLNTIEIKADTVQVSQLIPSCQRKSQCVANALDTVIEYIGEWRPSECMSTDHLTGCLAVGCQEFSIAICVDDNVKAEESEYKTEMSTATNKCEEDQGRFEENAPRSFKCSWASRMLNCVIGEMTSSSSTKSSSHMSTFKTTICSVFKHIRTAETRSQYYTLLPRQCKDLIESTICL